jgi:hypothetical protein
MPKGASGKLDALKNLILPKTSPNQVLAVILIGVSYRLGQLLISAKTCLLPDRLKITDSRNPDCGNSLGPIATNISELECSLPCAGNA